jgi:hypothetical protein
MPSGNGYAVGHALPMGTGCVKVAWKPRTSIMRATKARAPKRAIGTVCRSVTDITSGSIAGDGQHSSANALAAKAQSRWQRPTGSNGPADIHGRGTMADSEPLLCKIVLGKLVPMTSAAEDAIRAIGNGQTVRIDIVKTRGNQKRLSWYWVMLKLALDNLADAFDGPATTQMLHKWLKREAGLAKPIISKKTSEVLDYDYDSIAFHNMTEDQRASFIDFASQKLAVRLGVDPHDLTTEARQAA